MAVLQMQRISICALKKNRKQLLETLQRRGVVEISDLSPDDDLFVKSDTSSARAQFEKSAATARQALAALDLYAPVKSSMLAMFEGRTTLSTAEYDACVEKRDATLQAAYRINALVKSIAEQSAEQQKLQTQLDALVPWMGLGVSLRFTGTRTTAAFIGAFPGALSLEEILTALAVQAPALEAVSVDVISTSREQTCVFIVAPRRDAAPLDEALRAMGFTRPASPAKQPPAERKVLLNERMALALATRAQAETEICGFANMRDELRFLVDYFTIRLEKYRMLDRVAQTKNTVFLTGFIPARISAQVRDELSAQFDLAIELCDPDEDEDVPVLLQNNGFSAPVESVVESYSLPGKGEIDPTTVMSFFYYVLFGMMLSDAGYGLIMTIACGLVLYKFKGIEPGLRKMVKMFFFCGISTVFWGFMFGSFFGDAVGVIASTFFHSDIKLAPLWFEPVAEPIRLLAFSFLIGIIHLFTGLALKFYQLCKQGKFLDAIYDVVFWYLLVGGGVVYALTMDMVTGMLGLGFSLSPTVATIAAYCAGIGTLGIVLFGGRDAKNPVVRLFKGLYDVYNVTGYLSDILSYSRLLALGLATGVIATVFNKMGSMGGGGIVGAILFILVFAIGHTLNIGINLLGAYVHTNRLQFVEFFGKFYEGGGRAFAPFAVHTKYYKFREEI